jgi:hypothetical protein
MRVFHGSYIKVNKIDLSKRKPNKDFGKGFYVTRFRNHAEDWAKIIGEKYGTEGIVSEFEFSENNFTKSICQIKRFDTFNEEWLNFVVKNRDKNREIAANDYDIAMISEPIIEKLIVDFKFDEEKATNLFFDSVTYSQLSETETKLYEKDWTEIYDLLLNEFLPPNL